MGRRRLLSTGAEVTAGGGRGERERKVGDDGRRYGGDKGSREVDIHERRRKIRLGRRCPTPLVKLPARSGSAATTATGRGAKAKERGDGGVVRQRREGGGWRSRKGEERGRWGVGVWGGEGSRGAGVGWGVAAMGGDVGE